MRGAFITFDGVDGCGKTAQLRRLSQRLDALGVRHVATRQPGGTAIGLALRPLVLENQATPPFPETELLIYAADRAQHVREVIEPNLAAGVLVLCDRYTDATVAFQGYGRGRDLGLIAELNRVATGGVMPDLTVVLDLEVGEAERRLARRASGPGAEGRDRFDSEAVEFHERVRRAYLAIAREEPSRVRVVDASGTFEEVGERVDALVASVIPQCHSLV